MCLHKILPHLTELTLNDDVMNITTHNTCIRPIIHTLTWFQWNFTSFTNEKENFWIFCILKLMVKPYPVCSMEFWNCLIRKWKCFWVKWLIIPARTLFLSAEHLPGKENVIADEESRSVRDRCDWMLNPRVFDQIQSQIGPCEIDLFASRLTQQLPRFFSWRPDPEAEETGVFYSILLMLYSVYQHWRSTVTSAAALELPMYMEWL